METSRLSLFRLQEHSTLFSSMVISNRSQLQSGLPCCSPHLGGSSTNTPAPLHQQKAGLVLVSAARPPHHWGCVGSWMAWQAQVSLGCGPHVPLTAPSQPRAGHDAEHKCKAAPGHMVPFLLDSFPGELGGDHTWKGHEQASCWLVSWRFPDPFPRGEVLGYPLIHLIVNTL